MLVNFDGDKLRKIRKDRDISQVNLADQVDCSDHYIRDLEHGRKKQPFCTITLQNCSCFRGSNGILYANSIERRRHIFCSSPKILNPQHQYHRKEIPVLTKMNYRRFLECGPEKKVFLFFLYPIRKYEYL